MTTTSIIPDTECTGNDLTGNAPATHVDREIIFPSRVVKDLGTERGLGMVLDSVIDSLHSCRMKLPEHLLTSPFIREHVDVSMNCINGRSGVYIDLQNGTPDEDMQEWQERFRAWFTENKPQLMREFQVMLQVDTRPVCLAFTVGAPGEVSARSFYWQGIPSKERDSLTAFLRNLPARFAEAA